MRDWVFGVVATVAAIGAAGTTYSDDGGLPEIGATAVCPGTVQGVGNAPGTVIGCWCPEGAAGGTVWGSDPYTSDSSLCAAARHAGQVPAGGGAIWVRIVEGQGSYAGSVANGVETSAYGAFPGSFSFDVSVRPSADVRSCPGNMQGQSETLNCACSEGQTASGTVWGSDIYTEDSNVCRAAVHAGVIPSAGGKINAIPIAGQQSYSGSDRNGVATQDYGPWPRSFIVTK